MTAAVRMIENSGLRYVVPLYVAFKKSSYCLLSQCIGQKVIQLNRPFPSSLVPLCQNESKCETFHMKMSSACSFIFMQIKVIFMRIVLHLDSL